LYSYARFVSGIGKKSAEYMQEFLETGTLQKLQEKKAGMM
jgi:DNA polymerase IV (family X)